MSVDRCVCCSEIIPEGGMVCPLCRDKAYDPPVWYAIRHKSRGNTCTARTSIMTEIGKDLRMSSVPRGYLAVSILKLK